jgi:hypothetical protein
MEFQEYVAGVCANTCADEEGTLPLIEVPKSATPINAHRLLSRLRVFENALASLSGRARSNGIHRGTKINLWGGYSR